MDDKINLPHLADLKQQYLQLALEIDRTQNKSKDLNETIGNLQAQKRDLDQRAKALSNLNDQIKSRQAQRRGIGLLAISERVDNEEEIMRAKTAQSQALKALDRDYHVKPDGIPAAWQKLDQQVTTLENVLADLPDIERIQQQQQEIGQQYHLARKWGAKERENAPLHDKKQNKGVSLADKMVIAKAENQLMKTGGESREYSRGKETDRDR